MFVVVVVFGLGFVFVLFTSLQDDFNFHIHYSFCGAICSSVIFPMLSTVAAVIRFAILVRSFCVTVVVFSLLAEICVAIVIWIVINYRLAIVPV